MIKIISFSININKGRQLVATPKRQNIANSFDYIGLLVGTTRLPNESNVELKNKILDASVNPSGPTYIGSLNGITRDLGYTKRTAFYITLKQNSDGSIIANSPRVDILANKIILYKDWRLNGTKTIDKEIKTYSSNDEGYYLNTLIEEINKSECFSAELVSSIRRNTFSSSIVRISSGIFIPSQTLEVKNRNELLGGNISKQSLTFSDKETFKTEVFSIPTVKGEYQIDYINGIVYSYSLPKDYSSISYYINIFPLEIEISPVQVFSLNDENFKNELFNKETLDSGEEVSSLLNHEGVEIYNELFKNKIFWGE